VALPPLALLLLGWLGRYAAAGPSALAAASAAAEGLGDVGVDVGTAASLDTSSSESSPDALATDAGIQGARAIEALADGGFVIDLNLASEDELRKLPGVGPARARAVVALRARLGRLKSVDDLARIKGFGRALVRRLRPLVRT
jgi:competence protein ComEA